MDRNSYLQFCRYFDGSKVCPFKDETKATLWKIEANWVVFSLKNADILHSALADYLAAGLQSFEKMDDTPASLKAFLFNRLTKYEERVDIEGFKKFYKQYYS